MFDADNCLRTALVHAQSWPQDIFSLEIIPRVSHDAPSTPTYYNNSNPIYLASDGGVTSSPTAFPCNLRPGLSWELGGQLFCLNNYNALGIRSDFTSQPLAPCIALFASDRPVGCFNSGFKYRPDTKLMEWPSTGSRFWLVETRDGAGDLIDERRLWASIGKEESAPIEGARPVSLRVHSIYKMPTGPHLSKRYSYTL